MPKRMEQGMLEMESGGGLKNNIICICSSSHWEWQVSVFRVTGRKMR